MSSANRVGVAAVLFGLLVMAPAAPRVSDPPSSANGPVLGVLASAAAAADLGAPAGAGHDDGALPGEIESATAIPATTPGVTYRTFDGVSFRPDANDDGSSKYVVGGGISPAAYGWYMVHLDVPHGAHLTELAWYVKDNAANNVSLYLYRFDQSGASGAALVSVATTGASASIQTLTPSTNVVVDNTNGTYVLYMLAPADPGLVLYGARVGYVEPSPTFYPVDPTRVYDSRAGDGRLVTGDERTVSVATKAGGGPVVVPPGARAVVVNVTLDQTVASGFLSVRPAGTAWDQTSTANWYLPNAILANGTTVKLGGDRQVTVLCGGGGSTEFLLDVVGYYL
jgi:hypothetical protein